MVIEGGGPGQEAESLAVAVLALQGDFEAHRRALEEIGVASFEARRPADLARAGGLIIPGGESTTLWKFFEAEPWEEAFRALAATGRPVLGTCAGAIVLAREVSNPPQKGLGLVDVEIERNAYGRQVDSFIAEVESPALGPPMPAVFIRAPRIRSAGPGVEILARHAGEPVLVRQGNVVAATFHPELTGDRRLHRLLFAATTARRRSA
ncbi:MAG TPA: pyridoxal 5'-phosphate synthase glutaminase subunit PdxT [Thermoanaerobaculia bacterium]|jgi:5'-phosphate synthase pdxT subunit|nr:pyridoxal 5'-phosphate synthase glutaminase subunit PdxT [Thermoanaerobaculia bacterium]